MSKSLLLVALCLYSVVLSGQPEVAPWSNISGIRLDGELMELNSTVGFVGADWSSVRRTAKERAGYSYERNGNSQHTPIRIDSFFYDQTVENLGAGKANVRIQFRCEKDTQITGTFFMLQLPVEKYAGASVQFIDPSPTDVTQVVAGDGNEIIRGASHGLIIKSALRNVEIKINEGTEIFVRKNKTNQDLEIYFALMTGNLKKGTQVSKSFMLQVGGVIDRNPVSVVLNTTRAGKVFKGFGGNFRLQNPTTDPPVIDYCLENLEVRYGRVEMPWMFWHPAEDTSPLVNAEEKGLHPRVKAAMEMGQRLHQLGMPVILSDWSAPRWAIVGDLSFGPQPDGLIGNALDSTKLEKIYQSIGDYIQYAHNHFGFEFEMFSFNESDLGINVRQTSREHAHFIKGLGAHLKQRGIKTKLLLGDTADANGWPFIKDAMEDPTTHPFIGAISFHSWRGYTDENLQQWADAAETMKLPLLVGEGSMDAGAWRYPDIFSEYTYAMEEINLYLRILRICQPASILQWQLTADYSPLKGGGVFGNHNITLQPTQRFWNFKQIANMPSDLHVMPVEADKGNVECIGLGDNEKGIYVVHLVNNGPSREMSLSGLPETTEWLKIFLTNENNAMSPQRPVRVRDGVARFTAQSNSFISFLVDGERPF